MRKRRIKRLARFLIFAILAVFLLSGCAGSIKVLKNVGKALNPLGKYTRVPPPQPGLVLSINESPGVWAECWLFEGSFSERDLILFSPALSGQLKFAKAPISCFTINPPRGIPHGFPSMPVTKPLLLSNYPADYTLLVFYRNARNDVVRTQAISFSTTGYFKNDSYTIGGHRFYADRIIRLARVKPYEDKQFKFERTFYPAHAVMRHLGFQ